jgi:hypothetical protein
MDHPQPVQGTRARLPHRGALYAVIIGYSLSLMAILALMVSHFGWARASSLHGARPEPVNRALAALGTTGSLASLPDRHPRAVVQPAHHRAARRPGGRAQPRLRRLAQPRASMPRRARQPVRWAKKEDTSKPSSALKVGVRARRVIPLIAYVHPPDPRWPPECQPPAPRLYVTRD